MSLIIGKWEMISTDKHDEYLKEIGVAYFKRKLAVAATPTIQYSEKDGIWTQIIRTLIKNFETVFKSGVEFDEELPDGRQSQSVVTIDGNTLTHEQNIEGKTSKMVRIFDQNEMRTTFYAGPVVAKRVFKRI